MPMVQAGSVNLEYFDRGDAEPAVVLVHGYRSSARIWDATQQLLAERGVRSVAISMRGAGASDVTAHAEDYSAFQFGQDLAAAVDALNIDRFILVGHSMGASTVTNFARDHEDRLLALVLLSGGALSDGRPIELTPEQQLAWDERIEGYPGNIDRGYWEAEHVGLSEQTRAQLWQDWQTVPPQRMRGIRSTPRDLQAVLRAISTPTLITFGDRDRTVPPESSVQAYLTLPSEQRSLQVFHGVDHSPNAVIPDRFTGTLARFIANVVPTEVTA